MRMRVVVLAVIVAAAVGVATGACGFFIDPDELVKESGSDAGAASDPDADASISQ